MRVDTRMVLKDYDGTPVYFQTNDGGNINRKALTLKDCFVQALNNLAPTGNPMQPNEMQTAETKAKIFNLTVRIMGSNVVKLTPDDMVFLGERVGLIWSANVYGRIKQLFDGDPLEQIVMEKIEPQEETPDNQVN